jgi:hypothetical protein
MQAPRRRIGRGDGGAQVFRRDGRSSERWFAPGAHGGGELGCQSTSRELDRVMPQSRSMSGRTAPVLFPTLFRS